MFSPSRNRSRKAATAFPRVHCTAASRSRKSAMATTRQRFERGFFGESHPPPTHPQYVIVTDQPHHQHLVCNTSSRVIVECEHGSGGVSCVTTRSCRVLPMGVHRQDLRGRLSVATSTGSGTPSLSPYQCLPFTDSIIRDCASCTATLCSSTVRVSLRCCHLSSNCHAVGNRMELSSFTAQPGGRRTTRRTGSAVPFLGTSMPSGDTVATSRLMTAVPPALRAVTENPLVGSGECAASLTVPPEGIRPGPTKLPMRRSNVHTFVLWICFLPFEAEPHYKHGRDE